jgi:uncharacterized protein (DUF486 family)
MQTVLLLTLSNIFMTFAWYGHLKYKDSPLWLAILVSWLIAFVEYCFQVPANRIGYEEGWSGARLKIVQEVITLGIFAIFSVLYLKEQFRWNYAVGFALMVAAVVVIFGFKAAPEAPNQRTVDPSSTAIKSAEPPSPV